MIEIATFINSLITLIITLVMAYFGYLGARMVYLSLNGRSRALIAQDVGSHFRFGAKAGRRAFDLVMIALVLHVLLVVEFGYGLPTLARCTLNLQCPTETAGPTEQPEDVQLATHGTVEPSLVGYSRAVDTAPVERRDEGEELPAVEVMRAAAELGLPLRSIAADGIEAEFYQPDTEQGDPNASFEGNPKRSAKPSDIAAETQAPLTDEPVFEFELSDTPLIVPAAETDVPSNEPALPPDATVPETDVQATIARADG